MWKSRKNALKKAMPLLKLGTILNFLMAVCFASPQSLTGVDLLHSGKESKPVRIQYDQAKWGTVVVFLSANCPCSASHEPVLRELAKVYTPQGFQFVGVHSNADEELKFSREHFSQAKLGFPVLSDPKSLIANDFKAFKTPHVYVLNRQGSILFEGGIDNSHLAEKADRHFLKDALTAIPKGEKVPASRVRVLGCEIKRPSGSAGASESSGG